MARSHETAYGVKSLRDLFLKASRSRGAFFGNTKKHVRNSSGWLSIILPTNDFVKTLSSSDLSLPTSVRRPQPYLILSILLSRQKLPLSFLPFYILVFLDIGRILTPL